MTTRNPLFERTEDLTAAQLEARSRYSLGDAREAWTGRFYKDAKAFKAKSEEYAALAKAKREGQS